MLAVGCVNSPRCELTQPNVHHFDHYCSYLLVTAIQYRTNTWSKRTNGNKNIAHDLGRWSCSPSRSWEECNVDSVKEEKPLSGGVAQPHPGPAVKKSLKISFGNRTCNVGSIFLTICSRGNLPYFRPYPKTTLHGDTSLCSKPPVDFKT